MPIAGERYFLICARKTLQYPWVEEVLRLMRGPEFQELVASLPGYLADHSGEIMELVDAFPWLRRAAGKQRAVQERKRPKAA